MKKSLLLVLLPLSLYAHERITLFKSDITVNTDASMLVRETIKVVSEQKTIIHGIVREFPTRYRDYAGTNYNVGFELLEITQDGASVAYHVNDAFNGKKIYIGSKYEKVQPGEHSYMISYKTNRQLGFYDKFDELYWNVTGSGWRLPIEKVEAIVHVPQGTPTASIKAEGYTGQQGAKGQDYTSSIKDDGIYFQTTRPFQPYEGFTIVVTWPKGIIEAPTLKTKIMWFFKDNIIVLLLLLAVLFIMLFLLYCLTVLSRNNQPGLVVPLFYPPENMTPSEIGFMKNRGFKNDLVGADIVNLAVKGFITIAQNEGFLSRYEYTLTRTDQTQGMSEYDKDLLSSLFRNGQTVHIGKSQSSVISSAIDCVRRQCTKIAGNYISQDLINLMYKTVVLPIAGVIAFVIFEYHTPIGFIFCFIWIGIIFLVSPLLTLYTPQGRKLQDGIDGFELYLNTAEVDRMKIIGTPPTKTPELYEKYLPYAMALGVEDQWTEQFSSLFEKLEREGHPYRPRWYIGSRYRGVTFAHRLNSSLSSSISSSGKVPGRSSGSGGRGSSGGGGGGGGGGGW